MNVVNTVKRALEDATCSLLDAIVTQYMFESDIVSPRRFPSYMTSSPACLRMVSSAARERGLIEQLYGLGVLFEINWIFNDIWERFSKILLD